jgi:hypothetical protein
MSEALYVLEFGDIYNRTIKNGGIAVLETNRIFGGDSGFYYLGTYSVSGDQIFAKVHVTNYNSLVSDVWGLGVKKFDLTINGKINGKLIEGEMSLDNNSNLKLFVRFTKMEELP